MSKTTLESLNTAHIKDLIYVITDNETSKQIQIFNILRICVSIIDLERNTYLIWHPIQIYMTLLYIWMKLFLLLTLYYAANISISESTSVLERFSKMYKSKHSNNFFFLAMPHSLWDFNSLTRDWTQALHSESSES